MWSDQKVYSIKQCHSRIPLYGSSNRNIAEYPLIQLLHYKPEGANGHSCYIKDFNKLTSNGTWQSKESTKRQADRLDMPVARAFQGVERLYQHPVPIGLPQGRGEVEGCAILHNQWDDQVATHSGCIGGIVGRRNEGRLGPRDLNAVAPGIRRQICPVHAPYAHFVPRT